MSIFEERYADLYEIVYASKEYPFEVDVVRRMLADLVPDARSLLDFGCGTGKHATLFAQAGLEVTGLDRSSAMLRRARESTPGDNPRFFHVEEAAEIPLGSMDAAVSLFDVVSYLVEDADLEGFFELVRAKTGASAPLVFDFWHLPAVIHLKPETRKKVFKSDELSITRVTEPAFDIGASTVRATHNFFVEEDGQIIDHFSESHAMRCFTKNEILRILEQFGYRLHTFGTWQNPRTEPGLEDWSVLVVAVPSAYSS